MPTLDELRLRYSASSDRELREAHAAGQSAYTDEAWEIISAEFSHRGLQSAPETESLPPEDVQSATTIKTEPSVPHLSDEARKGEQQLKRVVVAALVLVLSSGVLLTIDGGFVPIFAILLRFAVTLSLAVKALEGKSWARWILAAFVGSGGILSLAVNVVAGADENPDFRAFSTLLAIGYLTVAAILLFSPRVSSFFREHARLRTQDRTTEPLGG